MLFKSLLRARFALGIAGLCSLAQVAACAVEIDGAEPFDEDEIGEVEQALGSGKPAFGAIAAEQLPDFSLAQIKSGVPLLQGKDIALVLHWSSANLDDASRWAIVADARARGVEVQPWLLLPEEMTTADRTPGSATYAKTGYFINTSNYAEYISKAKALMALWAQKGYAPSRLVVDMEMRRSRLETFAGMIKAFGPFTAISATDDITNFLRAGIDTAKFASATKAFKDFVDYAHSKGWKVDVTTQEKMVDDYSDNDASLRQAFGIPLDGIAWDTVSFQTYRTMQTDMLGNTPFLDCTPFYVQDYARMARKIFGARTGVSVGLIDGGVTPGTLLYTDGIMLSEDIEAALEAGIPASKIAVYSLAGIVKRGPSSQWLAGPSNHGFGWPLIDFCSPMAHAMSIALDTALGTQQ